MSVDIARMLRQLTPDELAELAKMKRVKIKETWDKNMIVDVLSAIVKQRDILEFLSKHGRAGAYAVIDGKIFEQKALTFFSKRGYKCDLNVTIEGMEFDIIGEKTSGGWRRLLFPSTTWILAECKNKPKVIMQDFDKFLGKYTHFAKQHGAQDCKGFLVTSGVFDPTVKRVARTHKNEIKLRRIKD